MKSDEYTAQENARSAAMLSRVMLLDALTVEADVATVRRLAIMVRESSMHLLALLDRGRNAQARETAERWFRMAAALIDADAVVADLAVSVERRRERNRRTRA